MSKSVALLLVLALLTAAFLMTAKPTQSFTTVAENSWATKASIPFEGSCEAAVVNGKIYVFAGGANYEYDPAIDNWTTKAPMPSTSWDEAAVVVNDKIYVLANSVPYEYDPETDTWKTGEPMPTARSQFRAEAVNGKIYVISGRTGEQYTTVKTNEAYDPETDSWETKAEIPYHVASGGSTVLDDKIYVIGGQNEFHDPMNPGFVQIYDPAIDAWAQGTPYPSPAWLGEEVAATTGLYALKRIYVMGGSIGIGMATDASHVYDPEFDVWTVGASMPLRWRGFALVVVDDLLYAMGGFDGWLTGYSKNLLYTPFGYGAVPPVAQVVSPGNMTYDADVVSLAFTVNKPAVWMGYSLDGQDNITVAGNTTISGLTNGVHNITVYAEDTFGNVGASETVSFTVEVPFPVAPVTATSVAIVAVVGVGLLVYLKKRKRQAKNDFVKKP